MVFAGVIRYEGPTSDPLDDRYQQRLFIVDLASGAITTVTDGDGEHDDFDPYWSWNRGHIVFVRSATSRCGQCEGLPERVGQQQLWTVNPDGTGLRQLTSFTPETLPSGHGRELAAPVWSADGNRVAVVGAFTSYSLYSGDLWLLNVDASPVMTSATALRAAAGTAEWHPAFSPTGHKLVFARLTPANSREERSQIVIVDLATDSDRVIVSRPSRSSSSPTGTRSSPYRRPDRPWAHQPGR